ncbi:dUTP diphosphatase [Cohaesibacter celericrescens]|uniref:Deoxyuridine 5'-triphosphate nucleotidohydrolase n=1 Tax=Cohaesibacter celericrescens TaxID=2067669 RepID=A0A2N5XP37_9HYPH|nr:dUTP diphosphatase [Cohaesibacter celericrescens]PLW76187.1 dUTP diphosphatase [Cohaesibacter celericrescens]
MARTQLSIMPLPHFEGLELPCYKSNEAAGLDLQAANPEGEPVTLEAKGGRALVPVGFCMALDLGFEAQIRPRSGLALKHGVTLLNTPGTIDSDYRGEVKVLMINHGEEAFIVERGMRIAQMVIAPVLQMQVVPVDTLDDTERGAGGFGSTGHKD